MARLGTISFYDRQEYLTYDVISVWYDPRVFGRCEGGDLSDHVWIPFRDREGIIKGCLCRDCRSTCWLDWMHGRSGW